MAVQTKTQKEIERQEKELARLLDWISKADSKAQILIGAALAMIGGVLALVPKQARQDWIPLGLVAIACLLPVFVLYECFSASMPHVRGPKTSLIFFRAIASICKFNPKGPFKDRIDFGRGLPAYERQIRGRTDQSYLSDLNAQCLANSVIADAKYRRIKRAWFLLIGGAAIWITTILGLYRNYSEDVDQPKGKLGAISGNVVRPRATGLELKTPESQPNLKKSKPSAPIKSGA